MTLRRLGRTKEANSAVAGIKPDLDVIENGDYYKLIRLYQGKVTAEDLMKEISGSANSLSNASVGYGLGNWMLYNGKRVRHYALTNEKEFFAEMTEAYFGVNDFFPFTRAELRESEPDIHALLRDIWEAPVK